ncbi:GNAT family N-acetyltransferase [filamentous cyanobacterium LEGE 11480]|uniref:GNAT family N-acetyltransferase n=1 Tax=Romeriopsis navalis LEGE 11480 TaxID=2777977 RepID=A0A928VQC5_9CYAN|nr:GNAT family N-acetyltransferase [Romeriopsis navalis]MBE9032736.1 GNAT family N-acetyltransferase [Romeriopsis navalis LEGE 11480]
MHVVYKLTDSQISELHQLYRQEWWTESRTIEETKSCIEGSQICIGLVDEAESLIGFARILTDYTFKALIFDVIVSKSSRKLGLGDRLMKLIQNHPALSKVQHFELYCLPEMFAFYQKYGFSEQVGKIQLMRQTCLPDTSGCKSSGSG